MRMIPTSAAVFFAAAASLLLGPVLAIGSSHPGPYIMRTHDLKPDDAVQWHAVQDTAAPAAFMGHQVGHKTDNEEGTEGSQATAHQQILTHQPQGDYEYSTVESTPLDGGPELQPELKRSEDGGEGTGAVLLRRETSAAPTVFGVSIWLIIAWLGLLYLMYKTGSMF
ncbi:hypothetical protein INS49_003528 [Diaporthe citri]|uniref:uncharacterized protein n=1 Tax=Diaporthe citri TaxID=83186 RepID=UPI001C7F7E9A|nr:uncharacterized protein INS49_003528 [Diaporthe citri]KAG6355566.1 hypothetical protein INS49_003528 [Diaporthe citri]